MSWAPDEMLLDAVDRVLAGLAGRSPPNDAWLAVEEIGIGLLLVPEAQGGFGGSFCDACTVLQRIGRYAIALPIAETLIARGLIARAGIKPPLDPLTFSATGVGARPTADGLVTCVLEDVPWGASAAGVLIETRSGDSSELICLGPKSAKRIERQVNLADEPRDRLEFESVQPLSAVKRSLRTSLDPSLFEYGALMRTAQTAGGLEHALELSARHAAERAQFGRKLNQFQAIQHQLAVLAEETAAVQCAALAACRALDTGDASLEIPAAKLRANRAIGTATAIAHQIHGAVGVTQEHELHRTTRRLWAWRSEFGNDRFWALRLGQNIARDGAERLWPELTDRGDRVI